MGKQKKERKHALTSRVIADPTGAALTAALMAPDGGAASSSASTVDEGEHAQQALLSKLHPDSSLVQKAVACSGVAHILACELRPSSSVVTPALLKRLLPLLLDRTSYDVTISAAGAARNISAVGAHTHGSQAQAQARQVLQLLLNGDAVRRCT